MSRLGFIHVRDTVLIVENSLGKIGTSISTSDQNERHNWYMPFETFHAKCDVPYNSVAKVIYSNTTRFTHFLYKRFADGDGRRYSRR